MTPKHMFEYARELLEIHTRSPSLMIIESGDDLWNTSRVGHCESGTFHPVHPSNPQCPTNPDKRPSSRHSVLCSVLFRSRRGAVLVPSPRPSRYGQQHTPGPPLLASPKKHLHAQPLQTSTARSPSITSIRHILQMRRPCLESRAAIDRVRVCVGTATNFQAAHQGCDPHPPPVPAPPLGPLSPCAPCLEGVWRG